MFHLVFFNTIIGVGESVLLCLMFRTILPRFLLAMLAANYASAYVGKWFIESPYCVNFTGDLTIENLVPVFWKMVYVLFFITLIVEFPFFVAVLYKRKWLIPKAVATTLIIHCISYYLLFHFYGGTHRINMVTECEVVTVDQMQTDQKYDLYYISADGKKVMKSDLNGMNRETIVELDEGDFPDRLFACPKCTEKVENREYGVFERPCSDSDYDLFIFIRKGKERLETPREERLLIENFTSQSSIEMGWLGEYRGGWDGTWHKESETVMNYGRASEVDCDSKWEYWVGYWPDDGIRGAELKEDHPPDDNTFNKYKEGSHFRFFIETPIAQWKARNAAHISGDYAVFQLGKDQICILQPQEKKIALITRGFGPVVAVKHAPVSETIPDTKEPGTSPEPTP